MIAIAVVAAVGISSFALMSSESGSLPTPVVQEPMIEKPAVLEENISILYVNNSAPPLDLFSMGNFEENWKSIDKNFEYIFMCADNDEAITLVRAIGDLNVYHILLAKTKLTKSSMLSKICTIIPIQGLLHD